jgi:hypothetical protein
MDRHHCHLAKEEVEAMVRLDLVDRAIGSLHPNAKAETKHTMHATILMQSMQLVNRSTLAHPTLAYTSMRKMCPRASSYPKTSNFTTKSIFPLLGCRISSAPFTSLEALQPVKSVISPHRTRTAMATRPARIVHPQLVSFANCFHPEL